MKLCLLHTVLTGVGGFSGLGGFSARGGLVRGSGLGGRLKVGTCELNYEKKGIKCMMYKWKILNLFAIQMHLTLLLNPQRQTH